MIPTIGFLKSIDFKYSMHSKAFEKKSKLRLPNATFGYLLNKTFFQSYIYIYIYICLHKWKRTEDYFYFTIRKPKNFKSDFVLSSSVIILQLCPLLDVLGFLFLEVLSEKVFWTRNRMIVKF